MSEYKGTPDRVGVELGALINTGNFENFTLKFSLESDRRPEETPGEAFERVFNFVHKRLVDKGGQVNEEVTVQRGR